MKINRLLEITIILLNRGTVTARELAERFGVSTRTIYRDIDDLSASGVPVYATQGVNGGISLLENFLLNRTLLSDKDCENILFALKSLETAQDPEIERVLEKLGAVFKNSAPDWIQLDFSPWSSAPNQYNKFTDIKHAVLHCKKIVFDYISADNIRSTRHLEPLRLIFKEKAWYLWGWSEERQDYRTFRISRIKSVKVLDETFVRQRERRLRQEDAEASTPDKPLVELELCFKEEALYRLYDDYADTVLARNEDGSYTVNITFPEDDWVYGYILSFGDRVKVLQPPHVRQIIQERLAGALRQYEDDLLQ